MADDLEARLKSHAKAFDGLLSLIPAKYYYGEDKSDQWKRKKQTKEEAQRAKRAKLDPSSSKSVKDILEENERKRKRDIEEISGHHESVKGRPEALQAVLKNRSKKPKLEQISRAPGSEVKVVVGEKQVQYTGLPDTLVNEKSDSGKGKEKKEQRRVTAAKKLGKQRTKDNSKKERKLSGPKNHDQLDVEDGGVDEGEREIQEIGPLGLVGTGENAISPSSISPTPVLDSPLFDVSGLLSGASSSSSVGPPPKVDGPQPVTEGLRSVTEGSSPGIEGSIKNKDKVKKPVVDPDVLRARLQARIEALRAARKADGINGGPARNRQELMDARRRKEEQRRAHKKELRQRAKEAEQREREAALASSSSPVSFSFDGSPRAQDTIPDNTFCFGRVAFSDGQQLDSDLSTVLDIRKRKGPQDPLTALKSADNKHSRISALDEGKRADIEEKDLWLNAKRRAHGEKIRDDSNLLKKTLKRKEKAKKRSETQWNERLDGVEKGKAMKQKRREENLRKRREEKGAKAKKKTGKAGKGVKNRPGFEGTFKGKVGAKGK